jgi:hypothetical protein
MTRGWEQGYFLMRGLAKVRAACSLTVLADHLRRGLNLVAMTRRLASFGYGGQGGLMSTTDRRLRLATCTLSRPHDRFNPLARPIQPSAMSFYTVCHCSGRPTAQALWALLGVFACVPPLSGRVRRLRRKALQRRWCRSASHRIAERSAQLLRGVSSWPRCGTIACAFPHTPCWHTQTALVDHQEGGAHHEACTYSHRRS